MTRTLFWNLADQKDIRRFPSASIQSDSLTFEFLDSQEELTLYFDQVVEKMYQSVSLDTFLTSFKKNLAFLIIRNDSIIYERYVSGHGPEELYTYFSVSKTILSMLIGIALDEGVFKSVNEPVTNYLPELKNISGLERITIEHLLLHTSGIQFRESYVNPFGSDVARFYYGKDPKKIISKLKIANPPGERFHYHSANTQLLGMALVRAAGMTLSAYAEQKIWSRIGTQADATWSIYEKEPVEKAFCCFNSTPRDMARFGKLLMQDGNWNGDQIIPKSWLQLAKERSLEKGSIWGYQYHLIVGLHEYGDFMAQGLYNQYLYVMPKKKIIIVMVNDKYIPQMNWPIIFRQLVDQL